MPFSLTHRRPWIDILRCKLLSQFICPVCLWWFLISEFHTISAIFDAIQLWSDRITHSWHTHSHTQTLFVFESNVSRRDDHKHSKRLSRFLQLTRHSLLAYSRRFVLSNPIHLLSVRKLPKRTHLKEKQTAVSSVWPIDVPSRMAVDLMVDCAIINLRFWITTILLRDAPIAHPS